MTAAMKRAKGECRVCGKVVTVMVDGYLVPHLPVYVNAASPRYCDGANRKPRQRAVSASPREPERVARPCEEV